MKVSIALVNPLYLAGERTHGTVQFVLLELREHGMNIGRGIVDQAS